MSCTVFNQNLPLHSKPNNHMLNICCKQMKSIDNNKMMDGLSTNLIKEPVPLMMQEYVILVFDFNKSIYDVACIGCVE